jgi:pimeloyl-ACP methyl ester carboxylesterase
MHLDCTGSGSATVILESGLGDSYISWQKVQTQIARFTRVCSYDRAGLGYSDSTSRSPTSKNVAQDLHALLHNAGTAPPFILVGHSIGGFYVRFYASLYRSEVAGIVLVDSSHPEQQKRFPAAVNDLDSSWLREAEFIEFTMPLGVPRLLGFCSGDGEVRAAECNFDNVRETVAELESIPISAAQTASTGAFGDLPLAVLSQDPETPQPDLPEDLVKSTSAAWQQMQNELAQLSTRSRHLVAKNSGHYIQIDRPEVVIEAVRALVKDTQQPVPLGRAH